MATFQPSQFSYGAGEITFTPKSTGETVTVSSQEELQKLVEEEKKKDWAESWKWENLSPLQKAGRVTLMVTTPTAMAVSYKRNKSLGWAFLSGFVSIPYLIYAFGFSDGATEQPGVK